MVVIFFGCQRNVHENVTWIFVQIFPHRDCEAKYCLQVPDTFFDLFFCWLACFRIDALGHPIFVVILQVILSDAPNRFVEKRFPDLRHHLVVALAGTVCVFLSQLLVSHKFNKHLA